MFRVLARGNMKIGPSKRLNRVVLRLLTFSLVNINIAQRQKKQAQQKFLNAGIAGGLWKLPWSELQTK